MDVRTCCALTLLLVALKTTCFADEPAIIEKPQAIESGDALPAFVGTDELGQPWKSTEHVGGKVLVLYFYPGDFTGGCIKQAEAFREGLVKLEEQGVELVGVSGDEAATHKLFKETYGLRHTLLADPKGEVAQTLGVPVGRGGKVRLRGKDGKLLTQPILRGGDTLLPGAETSLFLRPVTLDRWTIVVDQRGTIASIRRAVNPQTDAQEVLEIVAALPK